MEYKYAGLCRAFYISTTEGGLKENTSQGKIAEFFIDLGLSENSSANVMPTNPSSYDKWFSGINGQQPRVWKAFREDYKEEKYVEKLMNNLDDEHLEIVMANLGIVPGGAINKYRLALAVARQMNAFAEGKGKAENIMNDVYSVDEIDCDFADYITKATERYNVMKLIGGSEVALEDYFVCNTIGDRQRVITDKTKPKCETIEDATIEKIRSMYWNRRRYDNRKSILIGCGGSGKTLMMQHLFHEGISKFPESGVLPILLELRNFTQSDEIEEFVWRTVSVKDSSFTKDICHRMLMDGRCPLLMDGLDEIDIRYK